jgi:hypothetical protein
MVMIAGVVAFQRAYIPILVGVLLVLLVEFPVVTHVSHTCWFRINIMVPLIIPNRLQKSSMLFPNCPKWSSKR